MRLYSGMVCKSVVRSAVVVCPSVAIAVRFVQYCGKHGFHAVQGDQRGEARVLLESDNRAVFEAAIGQARVLGWPVEV